jgi:hypothetical protein
MPITRSADTLADMHCRERLRLLSVGTGLYADIALQAGNQPLQ